MLRNMDARVLVGICMILFLMSGGSALAGTEVMVAGVPHVRNGAEPAQGVEDRNLEEIWRVGGDDEDDLLLGIINRVLVDEDGNVYILDMRLSEVQVISPEGEWLRTLGRAGEGPGEINGPRDFDFLPDGTLGMVQTYPGKLVKLNLDGTPAGEVIPSTKEAGEGGFLILVICRSGGGKLVLGGFEDDINEEVGMQRARTFFIRGYDSSGVQTTTFMESGITWDFSDPGFKHREIENDFVWRRMDVGADGKVVACEPRNEYALSVYLPDGTLELVIERDYETWERTDQIYKRQQRIYDRQLRGYPTGTEAVVEKTEQDVCDLQVDSEGNIWVLTSRAMFIPEPGVFAVYDVFDPNGHFQKQVRMHCPGDASNDRMFFPGRDLAIQVTGFWDNILNRGGGEEDDKEPQPMQVVCYRIQ